MNKSAIVIISIGSLVLLTVLAWLGKPTGQVDLTKQDTQSYLQSDEVLYDFGTISMANGNVSHEFKITNTSDQPVNIRKISTSCMCTKANFRLGGREYGPFAMEGMGGLTSINATLNPGETAVAEAVYDPKAHGPAGVGAIDRFLYLDDASGGRLELEIKAYVTP